MIAFRFELPFTQTNTISGERRLSWPGFALSGITIPIRLTIAINRYTPQPLRSDQKYDVMTHTVIQCFTSLSLQYQTNPILGVHTLNNIIIALLTNHYYFSSYFSKINHFMVDSHHNYRQIIYELITIH